MTDRAEEEARSFAIEWYGPDYSDAFVRYLADFLRSRDTALAEAQERIRALEGALTPSLDTKTVYMGEFSFSIVSHINEHGDEPAEVYRDVTVPGTTIKEIMAAIRAYADARTILSPATEPGASS